MPKRHKSKALAALHESMADLHAAGAIDDDRMRSYDRACVEENAQHATAVASYHVYEDANGVWRWQLCAGNGKVLASSGEGFQSRAACLAAIELIKTVAGAPVAA